MSCIALPNIYALNNNVSELSTAEITALPDAYCMRDDYIVLAQNQDVHGYCWNFASTMAAATTLMKATGEFYDFSELWFGISAYCTGSYSKLGAGGGIETQYKAMQNSGLVLECDLPYQNSYITSNENAQEYYNFFNKYSNDNLANCLVSDKETSFSMDEVEEMKRHIYEQGSVYMAFSFRTGFIDDGPSYYLTPHQKNTNSSHAISVIGWDDNYTRELYVDGCDTPIVFKGAWMVLNSYTETNSKDGIAYIFYEDTNISTMKGYRYVTDTEKDFYFYDKIESGFAYPTNVIGKYYGDFVAKSGVTKQKNIFYDDVNLEYSYVASNGVEIQSIDIYLGTKNVTNSFDVTIDNVNKRFSISADDAQYGQYKVLVTYTDGNNTDTYLNNFFVTYGLIGEGVELDNENNDFSINTGRDLELYSFTTADKNYVIYTDKLNGTLSFVPLHQSVYSEVNMSVPSLSYDITDGQGTFVTHTVTSPSGYELEYTFSFEYYEDSTLQPVYVYYDLGGGVNNSKNHSIELASSTSDLVLYEPTREGYTFKGWYLGYGNENQKLSGENGVYYINWNDIHHMGESPKLNAISHYNKYYNNSNTVFVYARWEEENYYDVELNIIGNGSANIADKVSISSNDILHLVFDSNTQNSLTKVEINGVAVSNLELIEIAAKGIRLENLSENITVTATFSAGTYLIIDVGENIKSAYVTRNNGLKVEKYYSGQCISVPLFERFGISNLTLYVEVFDDEDGYTYIFDDADSYSRDSNGNFYKSFFVQDKNGIIYIKVGSATKVEKTDVEIIYSVPEYITEHYISSNPKATFGDESNIYEAGKVVYLFVKKPLDTDQYSYSVPSGYVALLDGWYRGTIIVNPNKSDLGEIEVKRDVKTYMVTWENWDGTFILSEKYNYGDIPAYSNKFNPIPSKPGEDIYEYKFIGWSPEIEAVNGNITYTAQFERVLKQYEINIEVHGAGNVTPSGVTSVEHGSDLVINIKPNVDSFVESIKINGEATEITDTLTFSDIADDISVEIIFKQIPQAENNGDNNNNLIIILPIVIASVVVIGGLSVLGFVVFKKRKVQKQEVDE